MIDIAKLTQSDIGRWVHYNPGHGDGENGKIKGWNESGIFVVYNCGGEWDRFKDYTAAHTKPSQLTFTKLGNSDD